MLLFYSIKDNGYPITLECVAVLQTVLMFANCPNWLHAFVVFVTSSPNTELLKSVFWPCETRT